MANYNSFLFDGHGVSEVDGSYDPGAQAQGVKEHDLVTEINNYAMEFLSKTSLKIHRDEQNFKDIDVAGNSYSSHAGASIHINAGGGTGVESYVPLNEKYLKFDFELVDSIAKELGIPNRGVRSRDYNSGNTIQRKDGVAIGGTDYYKEIRDAWSRGISLSLLEVGFIDTSDLGKMKSKTRKIGWFVARFICQICEVAVPAYDGGTTTTPTQPSTGFKVGDKVTVSKSATVYATGQKMADFVKGSTYTIDQLGSDRALLSSIVSWVYLKDLSKQGSTGFTPYTVKIVNAAIYVIDGPSSSANTVQTVYKDEVYTIVDEKNGYGKLKSGAGWIYLGYTKRN